MLRTYHGIDPQQVSSVVKGSPKEWFESYGFNVDGTLQGHDFAAIGEAYAKLRYGSLSPESRDRAALIATLEHSIGALPSSSRLRGGAAADA